MVVAAPGALPEPVFAVREGYRVPTPADAHGSIAASLVFLEGPAGEAKQSHRLASAVDSGTAGVLGELAERARRDAVRYPTSGRLWVSWGLALLNAGQAEEAVDVLREARALRPDLLLATIGEAQALARTGQTNQGVSILREVSSGGNSHPSVDFALGQLLVDDGSKSDEAVQHWERLVADNPNSSTARFFLGLALVIADPVQNSREAIHHLRAAVQAHPRSAAYHHALGVAYASANRHVAAIQSFKAAMRLSPTMPEALEAMARSFVASGQLTDGGAWLDAFSARSPNDVLAQELSAWIHFIRHDYQRARASLFHAFRLLSEAPTPEPQRLAQISSNLGVIYWNLGDGREAARMFSRALDWTPADSPDHWTYLTSAHLSARRLADARRAADAGLERFPTDAGLHLMRASVASRTNDEDAAIEHGRLAVEYGHSDESYAQLGGFMSDRPAHRAEAISLLREGLGRYPDHEMIRNNLAYALLMAGATADAAKVLEGFGAREPSPRAEPYVIATRGLLAMRQGELEQGAALYDEAAQRAQAFGDQEVSRHVIQKHHLEMARALLGLGKWDEGLREIAAGLLIEGRQTFAKELEALRESTSTSASSREGDMDSANDISGP